MHVSFLSQDCLQKMYGPVFKNPPEAGASDRVFSSCASSNCLFCWMYSHTGCRMSPISLVKFNNLLLQVWASIVPPEAGAWDRVSPAPHPLTGLPWIQVPHFSLIFSPFCTLKLYTRCTPVRRQTLQVRCLPQLRARATSSPSSVSMGRHLASLSAWNMPKKIRLTRYIHHVKIPYLHVFILPVSKSHWLQLPPQSLWAGPWPHCQLGICQGRFRLTRLMHFQRRTYPAC